jgi:hypothetical protein
MPELPGCSAVRPLLPELATGATAGDERARALGHVASCLECSRDLAELTKTADALLLLAPPAEPPVGFESRVLAKLEAPRRPMPIHRPRRRRTRAILALAAAVVLAAGTGTTITYRQTAEDRRLADQYRATLTVANGRYLTAARLATADARAAGTVFLYQGNPSWLLLTISAAPTDGPYDIVAIDRRGAAHPVGTCHVAGRTVTAGYELPLPVAEITQIQVQAAARYGASLTANVPHRARG